MNSVAPYPMTKPNLPPYDSLPPPPYAFNYTPHQSSTGYGAYYLQQYPSPVYDQASSRPSHVYPPGASYPSQHQDGLVVVVTPAHSMPVRTFFGHVALACFVVWCCNPLFGIISFILAVLAHGASSGGKEESARRLGNASLGVSFAGILLMTILIVIIMGIAWA